MAEGILRSYVGDRFEVASAGTHPSIVRPEAIEAMRETGIDISSHRSKSVDEFTGRPPDWVITVCDNARSNCPVLPGAAALHWRFDDPAAVEGSWEERLAAFREIRDRIARRLRAFPPPAIRPAVEADRAAVDALLAGSELVPVDLDERFGESWIVAAREGSLVGVAGVEVHGEDALLRSVAVHADLRGAGLGAELAANRIAWARSRGLRALYLLTTSAAGYWPRFGFERIDRG